MGSAGSPSSSLSLFHIDLFLGQAGQGIGARFYHHVISFGWCGVDLFFVLSGFLITGILYDTLNEEGYYRRFYVRRALRIFPVYYLFLACFFLIVPVLLVALGRGHVIPTSVRPATQGFAWFYLVNWFEGLRELNYFAPSIQHFWSLGVEEQFYLAWPFVVKSFPVRTLKRLTLALVAGSLVARAPWMTAISFVLFAATSLLGRRLSGGEFWMHALGPTILGLFFAGACGDGHESVTERGADGGPLTAAPPCRHVQLRGVRLASADRHRAQGRRVQSRGGGPVRRQLAAHAADRQRGAARHRGGRERRLLAHLRELVPPVQGRSAAAGADAARFGLSHRCAMKPVDRRSPALLADIPLDTSLRR
jgi:acyltransferase-like protein